MSSSAGAETGAETGAGCGGPKSLVAVGTSEGGGQAPPPPAPAAREAAAAPAAGVVTAAEELDRLGDDVDRGAVLAGVLVLPLAPLQAAVDGDRAALGQVPRAVLALGAPDRDVEVVGLVLPLAGRVVLAPRVDGDAQLADGHAAGQRAQLGVEGEVAGQDDPVDVGGGHNGLLSGANLKSAASLGAGPDGKA